MTMMMERPKTIEPPQRTQFEKLCDVLEELNVPDGYRAEIIGEGIIVSPWSQGFYLHIMDSLADQLRGHAPEGHRVSQAPCLYVLPGQSRPMGPICT